MHRLLTRYRRPLIELSLLAAIGVLMGILGPYDTLAIPTPRRYAYWLICIVGGGGIGIAVETALAPRIAQGWRRVLATALLMTPGVTVLVLVMDRVLNGIPMLIWGNAWLGWRVFVICLPVTAVRALVWRDPETVIETRTIIEPPLPEAEAAFRRRLSARRRTARLIAVEAEDHYLRVHTDAGSELLTLRFADALAELAGAHGLQVHRSWWIAANAIEAVQWRRGAGDARLAGDLTAPVSRTYAPALKAAGW